MIAQKIVDRRNLAPLLDEARGQMRIVFTNGCFDILHVGHVRLLQHARRLGDLLVVGVNSDASVRRLKGDARPLVSELERAEIIAALECVSYVTLFDEDTPLETIRAVRPHIHVKGGDYSPQDLPEFELLMELGARLEIFPTVPDHSSSQLIARAQQT